MMKTIKKTYVAPAAELILLAPMEALAATSISTEDEVALKNWGYKGVVKNASVTGSNRTCWCEDGRIRN